ncbi:DivIVA domain-containing protein [Georgenia sp. SUBG003]|uniref:DivIVA domain-containing protein n=1 Tax=Georgenia sp. SUBG003 TaxID=1497974 RepID=UPI003AB3A9C2
MQEPRTNEDRPAFPVVMRGYDRAQVDQRIHALETSLTDARREVATLDSRLLKISGELSEAQQRLRENERPTYAGLGSRVERLLRSAEEQALDVVTRANADAERTLTRAAQAAKALTERAEQESAALLADARRGCSGRG